MQRPRRPTLQRHKLQNCHMKSFQAACRPVGCICLELSIDFDSCAPQVMGTQQQVAQQQRIHPQSETQDESFPVDVRHGSRKLLFFFSCVLRLQFHQICRKRTLDGIWSLQLHKPCRLHQVLGEAATSSESQEQGKRERKGDS